MKFMKMQRIMKFSVVVLTFCLLGIGLYAQGQSGDVKLMSNEQVAMMMEYLNSVAKREGYKFRIGKTSVSNIPLERLCGLSEPEGWQKTAQYDNSNSGEASIQAALPSSFDWRTLGKVSPIKNQGQCGSCWAFGSLAMYEAAILIAGGPTEDLSEQYLLDCNNRGYSCGGGWFDILNFFSGGLAKESCYPYKGVREACKPNCSHYYPSKGWYYIGASGYVIPSVADIKNAIYTYGPVCAGVYVDSFFQNYKGGIFSNTGSYTSPNHSISLVGWDDSNGGYWILKNSWGTGWGESGYMRIAYNANVVGYGANYALPTVQSSNYILTVDVIGQGSVIMNPAGGSYAPGTVVTLTASPQTNYAFSNWNGDLTGTQNPITITMNSAKTVKANFISIAPPTAIFTSTNPSIAQGQTVTFTDASTWNPTSWSWSFPGGTPATSTVKNPVVTYNTPGTYSVTLTARNANGSNTLTKTNYVTVVAGAYCAANGLNFKYEWIAGVQIGSMTNTSAASGYTDYTSKVVNLTKGSTVALKLTAGYSGSVTPEYWVVWIDYNRNGSFNDAGEKVYSGTGSGILNGSFVVPASALSGATRIRVAMRYSAAPSSCGSLTYGEVEDYTAQIQ